MSNIEKRYNRALQIAEFLIEGGHNTKDIKEEFRISAYTFRRDLALLANYGYGQELARNRMIYIKARTALLNENQRRRQKKRG